MRTSGELMANAQEAKVVVPAFNMPYLPMMEPVVRALRDTGCFGFIAVARPDWEKFEARGIKEVFEEYQRVKDEKYTRLHLDHIPVIDEGGYRVDYESIIAEALRIGYQSVMVDGSRLPLEKNIEAAKRIVNVAHEVGIPVEGELGAVLGHESGPLPPYDELFASGMGFTDPDEARQFVEEARVDWLSVAIGNIHGAISGAAKDSKKISARINIEHLKDIRGKTSVPLVLHGGSGIDRECVLEAVRNGIAKINIGTDIRQVYEKLYKGSIAGAQEAVCRRTVEIIREGLEIVGSADIINP